MTEHHVVRADAFEIIHGIGAFLDLLVLDRQGLPSPGDGLIQGTVVEMSPCPDCRNTTRGCSGTARGSDRRPAWPRPAARAKRSIRRACACVLCRFARLAEQDRKVVERRSVLVHDFEIIGEFVERLRADRDRCEVIAARCRPGRRDPTGSRREAGAPRPDWLDTCDQVGFARARCS